MKRKFIPYIYIAFFTLNFGSALSQELTLKISAKDSTRSVFINSSKYRKNHISEISLFETIDSIKNKLEQKGFLNLSHNTIRKDSIYKTIFNLGQLNNTVRIFFSDKDISKEELFKITSNVAINHFDIPTENVSSVLNEISGIFEKEGYSFSQVYLQNIIVKSDSIYANLVIDKSKSRIIDNIIINGYKDFSRPYLRNYLGLKKKSVFNRSKLDKASLLINMLPFVSEIKPAEVLFTEDSTVVYLSLKRKNANKFDGLIGFTSKDEGGISFNGYLDLILNNVFNSGESFSLYWKNNGEDRQVFNIGSTVPFIFNTRISPEVSLNIFKQDSTFVNTKTKFLLPYFINERNTIGFSLYQESSSNLLTNNTNNDISDFSTVFYGINYRFQVPNNNTLFPTKINLFSEFLAGNRKSGVNNLGQSKINLMANYLWRLNFKNHIFIHNETSSLFSDNILTNELFRIGGVNSVRGFDEESIFASTYSFFNFEYRYNTTKSSYLYSISDLGYINNEIVDQSSQIFSLGLGYVFNSKLGVLNLSYAIGKFSDQPIDINQSRFHLKIISFF